MLSSNPSLAEASISISVVWLAGCDVSNRWKDLCDVSVRHIDDHLLTFYDAHLLMAYLGANSRKHVDEFLHSLNHYIRCAGFLAN